MVRSRQRVTRDAPAGREFAVAAARRESVDAAVAMLEAGGWATPTRCRFRWAGC